MSEKMRIFWSPEIETQFYQAYDNVLRQCPVAYEEFSIPTQFGDTHVIASGSKEAEPLVFINPGGGSAAGYPT